MSQTDTYNSVDKKNHIEARSLSQYYWRRHGWAGVGSAQPKGSWALSENFLKHMKEGLVSALKVLFGGLSPPGTKFLAPPLADVLVGGG